MSRSRASAASPRRVPVARSRDGDPAISDREFALFKTMIYRESGIHLPPSKRALLVRRLSRRLRELDLGSFGAYYQRVRNSAEECVTMLDCIATNETRFFREPRQFELLESNIVPSWREAAAAGKRPYRVRAWSAACSTGQEAYSLAMVLLQHLPPRAGWRIEVLASDISTRALEVAAAAVWPIEQIAYIPETYLKRFMMRGKGDRFGWIKAGPELRSTVSCRRLNLHLDDYPAMGSFDLILCRNVLIYFDHASRVGVLGRLLRHLEPDGYLFGGHAESLSSISQSLKAVAPTVYRHAVPPQLIEARA